MDGLGSSPTAGSWMWFVALAAGALAVAAVWAAWWAAIRRVPRWAAARGVPLTDTTAATVRRYVVVSHTAGVAGAVLGLLVTFPPLFMADIGGPAAPQPVHWLVANAYSGVGWPYVVITFWLAGVLAARFVLAQQAGGPARASLKRRTVSQYAPRGGIALLVGLFFATLAAVALGAMVVAVGAVPPQSTLNSYSADRGGRALAIVVAIALVQRFIVNRTQHFTGPDQLAADEAMRRASVRACTAAGVGLLGMVCADQLNHVGTMMEMANWQDPPAVGIWLQAVGKALGVAALGLTWAIFRGRGAPARSRATASPAAAQ